MELPERKRHILKAIVEGYISSAEPVSSKSISLLLGNVSPATIRNEMSELEDMGFLEKPHISAGRIPSSLAYQIYVDQLMEHYNATAHEVEVLQSALSDKLSQLDNVSTAVSRILSDFLDYPSISFARRNGKPVFSRIQIIPLEQEQSFALIAITTSAEVKNKIITVDHPINDAEINVFVTSVNRLLKERSSAEVFMAISQMLSPMDTIYPLATKVFDFICAAATDSHDNVSVDGAVKLLSHPEFHDAGKAYKVLDFLSQGDSFFDLAGTDKAGHITIKVGPKTQGGELTDTSFLFTTYQLGDDIQGVIGVVGPTRMDYAAISAKLEIFMKTLGKYLPVSFKEHNDKLEE